MPPSSGSFRHIIECNGYKFTKLIECPVGTSCYSPSTNPLQAMCLLGEDVFCSYVSANMRHMISTITLTNSSLPEQTSSIVQTMAYPTPSATTNGSTLVPTSSIYTEQVVTVTTTVIITVQPE